MSIQQEFFSDVVASQRRDQFRMRRLQVYNWGTFSGLHDISIAEQGFLFVGRSGSGKSTLLDALTALLIPPQWQVFNAAAREGDRSRRDRNLATYVRGAWGEQKDSDSGEIASQYLRRSSTWSALALTFANEAGRCITLVQLYWLRGGATATAEVKRHYMIAQRPFDIATELDEFDLDLRTLKNRLDDLEHFGTTFRPYSERFRQLVNIESEMALKLLHKTQSAKNLGDLNDFLREFMLEEPETFRAADRLVEEFGELDAAHREVVTVRRQVDTLVPARDAHDTLRSVRAEIDDREALLACMDGYREGVRARLLAQAIRELEVRESGLCGQAHQQEQILENHRQDLEQLQAEHRDKGGGRIEELESRQRDAEVQRDNCLRHRGKLEEACRTLGWSMPDSAPRFSEVLSDARDKLEAWRSAEDRFDQARDQLRDRRKLVEDEFSDVRREIQALERQPSNIPAHMLELRREMAETLGIGEVDLPFVGELLQVVEAEASWQGAIERVLHGFALSLLVDERHYAAVSAYVDKTHLGRKLVYYRWGKVASLPSETAGRQSLIHKLDIKATVQRDWLEAELSRRFDYSCVDNLTDFRREKRALSLEGQIRHGPGRHEKDDRSRLDDRRRWVLGFDNREKLALYQRRGGELAAEIAALGEELEALREERSAQQDKVQACVALANLQWQDVDIAGTLDRISQLDEQLRRLREGNTALRELGERIKQARSKVEEADKVLRQTRAKLIEAERALGDRRREREDTEQKLAECPLPEPRHGKMLDDRFGERGELTLARLDARHREVERGLQDELKVMRDEAAGLRRRIEDAFADFKREWPTAGADFEASLDFACEFFSLLKRLEWDGLPQHEERFFRLLREQSSDHLAALNSHLSQARKDIMLRLELVNEGLAEAEFNPGTHLQIDPSDRYLPEVKTFREQVMRIINDAWQRAPKAEEAEYRFLEMRELVHRLGGDDPDLKRWRNLVLDVRLHVEFIGKELDREGGEVEVYRSGAGKSGGQREKLSTTCLAAALRYQLGGSDGGLPAYAPVILDEAFGKADNEFTELALRIFERFGFQIIVATPLKAVMTLEPFIGGACFVEIGDRKHSATLPIEYDDEHRRLRLATQQHRGEKFSG